MKKTRTILALTLVLSMALLSACGKGSGSKDYSDEVDATKLEYTMSQYSPTVEGHLTECPNYALPADATEDEVRAMAVKAMNDELTFKWAPLQSFQYKVSTGASRDLTYDMAQVYGGIPYNNKARSLFHALEWYDYETGIIYGIDFNNGNNDFGNTCANSVIWGDCAVDPKVTAGATYTVCPGGGYDFVGVEGHEGVQKFNDMENTGSIIAEMTPEKVYEAYSMAKPADALLSCGGDQASGNHCMMVVNVNTVKKADGTIDPDASTIDIQDQWGKIYMEEGVGYCGRHMTFSFKWFIDEQYLVLRPESLTNYTGHEVAKVEVTNSADKLADLKKVKFDSNYRVVVMYGSLISESGTTVLYKHVNNTEYKIHNTLSSIIPNKSELMDVVKEGRNYTFKAQVRVATGELFDVCEFPVTIDDIK